MTSLYESLPIGKERREIRLLSLQPGSFYEDITCKLTVASLQDQPKYEALSYVWGDVTDTSTIDVNEHEHCATENLVKALRYLRQGISEPRVLWIDAVSINQRSEEEKSWQVAMMSYIYASCKTAIIWLGSEMERGDLEHAGWFSLTRMYPGIDIMMQMTLSLVFELAKDQHLSDVYLLDFREGKWDPIDNDPSLALQGINVLVHRPWWKRAWVVQEAVVPPKVVVVSGYLQLDWKHFESAAKNVGKHLSSCCRGAYEKMKGSNREYLQKFFNTVTPISVLRTKLEASDLPEFSVSFLELCYRFCDRHATLEKDKIFSLYSLLPESHPVIQEVPVDYAVSEDNLCRQITTALVGTGCLDVLAGDQWPSLDISPSWQKDFTSTRSSTQKYLTLSRYGHLLLFPPYQIASNDDELDMYQPRITTNDLLAVGGIHVDNVRLLSGQPYPERQELDTSRLSPWLIALEDIADGSLGECEDIPQIVVRQGQNLKEAFWRTMLGDHVGTKGRQADLDVPQPEASDEGQRRGPDIPVSGKDDRKVEESLNHHGFESVERLQHQDLLELVNWLPTMLEHPKHENLNRFEEAMLTMVMGRRFTVTQGGYFGLSASDSQVGDEVWLLQGGRLPFILRKEEKRSDDQRRFIGNCFIHSLTDGEVPTKVKGGLGQVFLY